MSVIMPERWEPAIAKPCYFEYFVARTVTTMSNPSLPSRNHSPRVFGLDLLRAIAVLSVLYVHGYYQLLRSSGVPSIGILKNIDGVDLFFVLSGFLIGGIIIRKFERERITLSTMLHFWKFRWFRTLPNYYLVLAITLPLTVWLRGDAMGFNVSYLFFLQNLAWAHPDFMSVAWSLAVEEWFYLLFPIMLAVMVAALPGRSFRVHILSAVLLMTTTAFVARLWVISPHLDGFVMLPGLSDRELDLRVRKVVLTRLDAIPFGVIGAYVAHYHARLWRMIRWPGLALGAFLHLYQAPLAALMTKSVQLMFFHHIPLAAVLFALPMASTWNTAPGWLSRPITIVSLISYSMYLIHYDIVIRVTKRIFGPDPGAPMALASFFFFMAVTIVISYLLYRFYEKPMTDLRNGSVRDLLRKVRGGHRAA